MLTKTNSKQFLDSKSFVLGGQGLSAGQRKSPRGQMWPTVQQLPIPDLCKIKKASCMRPEFFHLINWNHLLSHVQSKTTFTGQRSRVTLHFFILFPFQQAIFFGLWLPFHSLLVMFLPFLEKCLFSLVNEKAPNSMDEPVFLAHIKPKEESVLFRIFGHLPASCYEHMWYWFILLNLLKNSKESSSKNMKYGFSANKMSPKEL